MSYSEIPLGLVSYKVQSNYRTPDLTGTDFATLECDPPSLGVNLTVAARNAVKSGHYTLRPVDLTHHGSTLGIKLQMKGWSRSVPTTDPAAGQPPIDVFLRQMLGGVIRGGYQAAAVGSGSTTSQVVIDAAKVVTGYKVGGGLVIKNGSSYGLGIVKEVTDGGGLVDSQVDLLVPALYAAEEGTATYGVASYYLSTAALTTFYSLMVQLQDSDACLVFGGCWPTKIALTGGQGTLLDAAIDFHCHSVDVISGAALSAPAYTFDSLPAMAEENQTWLYRSDGVGGVSEVPLTSFSLELSQEATPTGFLSGVAKKNRMVQCKFSVPVDGAPVLDTDANATPLSLVLYHGTTAGGMFGLTIPSPILVAAPTSPADKDGLYSQEYTYAPGVYSGDTGSDASANSPFRLYLG